MRKPVNLRFSIIPAVIRLGGECTMEQLRAELGLTEPIDSTDLEHAVHRAANLRIVRNVRRKLVGLRYVRDECFDYTGPNVDALLEENAKLRAENARLRGERHPDPTPTRPETLTEPAPRSLADRLDEAGPSA